MRFPAAGLQVVGHVEADAHTVEFTSAGVAWIAATKPKDNKRNRFTSFDHLKRIGLTVLFLTSHSVNRYIITQNVRSFIRRQW